MKEDRFKVIMYISALVTFAIDAIGILLAIIFGILLGVGAVLQSQIMIIAAIIIAAINVIEIVLIPILLFKVKD